MEVCPVVGFLAAEDAKPSPKDVKKIDVELTKHAKAHESHMYPRPAPRALGLTPVAAGA